MIYNIFPPSKELETIVKQYVVIDSIKDIDNLIFLPNGSNFIFFNRGLEGYSKIYNEVGIFPIPKNYSVSIKLNKVHKFVLCEESSHANLKFPIILVELTPIGCYKLFKKTASIISKGYLELDYNIIEKYFKDLYTKDTIEEEIEYLNRSLKSLNISQYIPKLVIFDIVDRIINFYNFEVSIERLVQDFGCSRSTLERNFKKVIGLTPKNFIFISKFSRTVVSYIEDECTFNELEYIYSDSSHMNVVFKNFFGISPSAVLNKVLNNKIQIHQMKKLNDNY